VFYDLVLVDINMPHMNTFELCEKILAIDINVKVCFMSSVEINREGLREIYPSLSLGCLSESQPLCLNESGQN
jgi:CheY-like chemotaxis protein